jgi:adenylate cyclase
MSTTRYLETARTLLGDPEGWSLIPAIEYLQGDALGLESARAFTIGLMNNLIAEGAPITRVRIFFYTLHPLLIGRGVQWTASGGVEEMEIAHGVYETDDYIGSPAALLEQTRRPARYRLGGEALPNDAHAVLHGLRDEGMTDYLALPMVGRGGRISPVFITTDTPGGFTDADIEKLTSLVRFMNPVVQTIAQRDLSVALLETYLGPRTGRRVLDGGIKRGDGETIDAALWYSDLRDFTALTERLDAKVMIATLNAYFEFVHDAVASYGGEILRFIGDAMLIVFPAEGPDGRADACRRALSAARDALTRLDAFNADPSTDDMPEIRFGVGLHVGRVAYGNVGAPARLDFTVMGPAVNRTARLEGLTKQVDEPLLVSREFRDLAGCRARALGAFAVKGVDVDLDVYAPLSPGETR